MEPKVKLALSRLPGHIPGGGFHYKLFPMAMDDPTTHCHSEIFALMGYTILEVGKVQAEKMLEAARASLQHEVEVAYMFEKAQKP